MRPLIFLVVFFLIGCGQQSIQSPRLQEIQAAKKLVVGTAITQPFEYYDDTGKLVGFDVDLMNLIAARLGVQVEWREIAFADLLTELSAGNVDMVIAAMYIRPDREELVDMSEPYLDTGLVMVVRADETRINIFPDDLVGRTVGVKEAATGERYAIRLRDEDGIALEVRRYTDTVDSLEDLSAGLIDVVFNDRLNSLVYIQNHPELRVQGEAFDPAGLGISVRTGDVELLKFVNDSLDALRASGDIDRLFKKWISAES